MHKKDMMRMFENAEACVGTCACVRALVGNLLRCESAVTTIPKNTKIPNIHIQVYIVPRTGRLTTRERTILENTTVRWPEQTRHLVVK